MTKPAGQRVLLLYGVSWPQEALMDFWYRAKMRIRANMYLLPSVDWNG